MEIVYEACRQIDNEYSYVGRYRCHCRKGLCRYMDAWNSFVITVYLRNHHLFSSYIFYNSISLLEFFELWLGLGHFAPKCEKSILKIGAVKA